MKAVDSFSMEDYCVLVTASNDGFIKMWKLHLTEVRLCSCLGTFEGSFFTFSFSIPLTYLYWYDEINSEMFSLLWQDGDLVMYFFGSWQNLEAPTLLGEVSTSARLTCLAVWKPSLPQKITAEPAAEATTSQGGVLSGSQHLQLSWMVLCIVSTSV